jgi:hypothetical protein
MNLAIYSSLRLLSRVFLTIVIIINIIIVYSVILQIPDTKKYLKRSISLSEEINKHNFSFTNSTFIDHQTTFETTIQCIGSLYNQSCLYKNLYYVDSNFMILTIKGKYLPSFSVRTDGFVLWPTTPNKREFDTYSDLEKFVHTVINPKIIPSVTL